MQAQRIYTIYYDYLKDVVNSSTDHAILVWNVGDLVERHKDIQPCLSTANRFKQLTDEILSLSSKAERRELLANN